jgi:hypothetical protein
MGHDAINADLGVPYLGRYIPTDALEATRCSGSHLSPVEAVLPAVGNAKIAAPIIKLISIGMVDEGAALWLQEKSTESDHAPIDVGHNDAPAVCDPHVFVAMPYSNGTSSSGSKGQYSEMVGSFGGNCGSLIIGIPMGGSEIESSS